MREVKGDELRLRQIMGLRRLAKAVGVTLGANGGNVIMGFGNTSNFLMTKDGVTVAKHGFYITQDNVADAAATYVKQAAERTNRIAGDGTTTATVLAAAVYENGLIAAGIYPDDWVIDSYVPSYMMQALESAQAKALTFNPEPYEHEDFNRLSHSGFAKGQTIRPRELKDHLETYDKVACQYLDLLSGQVDLTPSEIVKSVSLTSLNGSEEISDLFVEAFEKVDMSGIVVAETVKIGESGVKMIDGFHFEGQACSPAFLSPDTGSHSMDDVLVFVCDQYVDVAEDLKVFLSIVQSAGAPFLLVCGDISEQLLNAMIHAMAQANLNGAVVKAPFFSEERINWIHDICAVTGAKFIGADGRKLRNLVLGDAGIVPHVLVDGRGTSFMGHMSMEGVQERVKHRTDTLRAQIMNNETMSEVERDRILNRISNLNGKFATVQVRVETEVEERELDDRLEDAINAVQVALKEGVVPGGGTALMLCASMIASYKSNSMLGFHPSAEMVNSLSDEMVEDINTIPGVVRKMMEYAVKAPFEMMIENSDEDPNLYLSELQRNHLSDDNQIGIDLRTMKVEKMADVNILDPVTTTKMALKTAISVAKSLIQTKEHLTNE